MTTSQLVTRGIAPKRPPSSCEPPFALPPYLRGDYLPDRSKMFFSGLCRVAAHAGLSKLPTKLSQSGTSPRRLSVCDRCAPPQPVRQAGESPLATGTHQSQGEQPRSRSLRNNIRIHCEWFMVWDGACRIEGREVAHAVHQSTFGRERLPVMHCAFLFAIAIHRGRL